MSRKARESKLPPDLHKALAKSAKTKLLWDDLTPIARRDFIRWIEQAKQPETRQRRVDSIGSRLASGKRRICCFAVVPMNLYRALGQQPKAKAAWSKLGADAKRDLVNWVDAGKDSAGRSQRVARVCCMLVEGKKRP